VTVFGRSDLHKTRRELLAPQAFPASQAAH
jgi:hypothetical protein